MTDSPQSEATRDEKDAPGDEEDAPRGQAAPADVSAAFFRHRLAKLAPGCELRTVRCPGGAWHTSITHERAPTEAWVVTHIVTPCGTAEFHDVVLRRLDLYQRLLTSRAADSFDGLAAAVDFAQRALTAGRAAPPSRLVRDIADDECVFAALGI